MLGNILEELREEYKTYDIEKIDEYVSNKVMDKVYGILKAYGFDCSSTEDDIIDFFGQNI